MDDGGDGNYGDGGAGDDRGDDHGRSHGDDDDGGSNGDSGGDVMVGVGIV